MVQKEEQRKKQTSKFWISLQKLFLTGTFDIMTQQTQIKVHMLHVFWQHSLRRRTMPRESANPTMHQNSFKTGKCEETNKITCFQYKHSSSKQKISKTCISQSAPTAFLFLPCSLSLNSPNSIQWKSITYWSVPSISIMPRRQKSLRLLQQNYMLFIHFAND